MNHQKAIKVQAERNISPRDLKGLKALMQENLPCRYVLVSLDDTSRETDGVTIEPWDSFLVWLGSGEYG